MKRKVLISCMFDVDTQESAFDIGVVTYYHNLLKDTLEVRVKSGFVDLM